MIRAKLDLTPGQWAQVRQIYDEALDAREGERLEAALRLCEGDGRLESAVGQLFSATGSGSFLDEPAGKWLLPPIVRLFADGTILCGRFRILRFISSGGMGDVYEAWDPNVREVVALKTIRPDLSAFPVVIERFQEEVRHAHQINHPHVCRVHDLYVHQDDQYAPVWFLTMQYLEGPTLREYLAEHGSLSPAAALHLIEQMIAGLTAAHDLGVVHRDFKPGNVMLLNGAKEAAKDAAKNAANGDAAGKTRAVITDFGLAAKTAVAGEERDGETLKGVGTPAYVAPEQWYKGVVSPASDQYSLGVVICEMVAGERPSCGSSKERADSPIELPKGHKLSARWQAVIRRCTAPRPEDRFPSLAEILPALDPRRRRRGILRRLTRVLILPVAAVLAMFAILRWLRPQSLVNPEQLTPPVSLSANPSLSRDGKMIAYDSDREDPGNLDIYVQHLPSGEAVRITSDPAVDDHPSLSPNGLTVAFRSERGDGGIYISSTSGGGEKALIGKKPVIPRGRDPFFSHDGKSILYWTEEDTEIVPSGQIGLLNLASGETKKLADGFSDARQAIWSSDGRHILFKGCREVDGAIPGCWDWWVTDAAGSEPQATNATAVLSGKKIKQLGRFAGWCGDTVFFNAERDSHTDLWALDLSPSDFHPTGAPREMIHSAGREYIAESSIVDGRLVALSQSSNVTHIWRLDHAADPGRVVSVRVTGEAEMDLSPSVSHNGRWLVFARGLGINRQILLKDLFEKGRETEVTVPGSDKFAPIIDDSGDFIAYERWEGSVPSIMLAQRSGQPAIHVCSSCRNPTGWIGSPLGFFYSNASMSRVMMYSVASGKSQTVLSSDHQLASEATWSPENQFLVFAGSRQAFAARYTTGTVVDPRQWVPLTDSSESIEKPRWSGDGKTVFYFSLRDGFRCLWGLHFDPQSGHAVGSPFPVIHYHDATRGPSNTTVHGRNLSAVGDSVYLNIGRDFGTIIIGKIE